MLPSTNTLLYDTFACAFDLRCPFLRLFSKTTHSFACKTNRIVAGVLQSIETITHVWSVSASSHSALFKSKTFSYYMVALEYVTCRNTLLNDSNDQHFVHRLAFTVNTIAFLCVFNL